MTRATLYPPANRTAQWYADDYPGAIFESIEKLCLHTTEGSGWPGYSGGAVAPNLTALPDIANRRLIWRHHFPINMSSRALRNLAGGVQTNTDRVVQVEFVGTCEKGGPGFYWPGAPDWALADVAGLVEWLHAEWALALNAAPLWLPYPASYGKTKARMSGTTWDAFRGVLGHQHVPENDHGDPGALDAARIITLAKGNAVARTLTDEDIAALAASPVFRGAVTNAVWRAGWGGGRQDGTTEYADWRLWAASHPESAVPATVAAVADITEGPLVEAVAEAVVAKLGGGQLNVTLNLAPQAIKDAVREVLTEGTGGTP
jgi:hypothetical protein